MRKYCIITNSKKDVDLDTSKTIQKYIQSQGMECILTRDLTDHLKEYDKYTDLSDIHDDIECAIVLGGDGTIIQAANDLVHKDIPILGVNLGTLGFLTEIEKHNIFPTLTKLFENHFQIEERMMLTGKINERINKEFLGYALNDIVISKSGLCRVITIKVYVNGELIDTYRGDGVIISTPTGSTAYNLSAGGPVVAPGIHVMIITPICPHSLNNRCIVISAEDKVVLELSKSKEAHNDEGIAAFDGKITQYLSTGDTIEITKAKEVTKLIKVTDSSFFEILRNKIGTERNKL